LSARILLRKTSLVDYPGRVSSVFFFSGCNLRCPWCHNRELVLGGATGLIAIDEALAHVRKRGAVLGGVVLSGGEPCLWDGLPELISEIKKIKTSNGPLGVKLDTNGMFPAMLEKLFSREETRPDYIAMDLKLAPPRYAELLPAAASFDPASFDPARALLQSAALIRSSGLSHEFRSLKLPGGFFGEEDRLALAPLAGDSPWQFRDFIGGNCIDPAWDKPEGPK
jgi:pyruvate formate lyase activating enzyme